MTIIVRWLRGEPITASDWLGFAIGLSLFLLFVLIAYTMRNRAEERGRLLDMIQNKIAQEEETEALKDHLISMTAHELKTPLTVLQGYAQMIARTTEPHQIQIYANHINQESRQLSAIIGSLLEIDPSHQGKLRFQPQNVDLRRIVDETLHRFSLGHPEEAPRVKLVAPSGLIMGIWDPLRVGQAVLNVLENAVKYSEDEVQVEVAVDEQDAVRICVTDRGTGISKEEAQRIFQPYYRSQRSHMRGAQGMGLGLTIADKAVKLHGGEISVNSQIGRGTTMCITLPLTPVLRQ